MPPVTCEFIATARPIDRATIAEAMANTQHKVTRCDTCEKYHVWVPATSIEWGSANYIRMNARTDNYVQAGVNTYLHKGHRKPKVGRKVDDNDD